jgi:hypothetical protein
VGACCSQRILETPDFNHSAVAHGFEGRNYIIVTRRFPSLTKLDAQVKDTYLKDLLRRSQNLVGDVGTFFIRHAPEARSAPQRFSMWPNLAESTLNLAAQQREGVQDIVGKYGTDAQSIGG